MLLPVLLLTFIVAAQGRAVNISNTWVLPEEGFPVFYRYFRDRISWYEADAVCQFHHANLVTVDTTAQYDAVRAYLKELDISSAVWVGLIRSNPDGEFTWTDYRGLSGDGYWSVAPDARAAPLCAAANPVADYRWEARACGGPTVASFICELPVPQWALGNQGCMVKALPALTILYLPESAAVQLTADCGLAGTKQVQCMGSVKHEDLLRNLSCAEEDETSISSLPLPSATSTSSNDTAIGDQDLTSEVTTEDSYTTTEHFETSDEGIGNSSIPFVKPEPKQKQDELNKFKGMYTQKKVYIELAHNNNMQSNDIPMLAKNENVLTLEESEKLEDEKNKQHKLLHDELARHGNFETIFTQTTDHFVPPLVMAKSKISDDMTVLSLAEKHAQQLAEQRLAPQKLPESHMYSVIKKSTTEEPSHVEIREKSLVMSMQPAKSKYAGKKEKTKLGLPKKYNDKYTDSKSKNIKMTETKLPRNEKLFNNSNILSQIDQDFKSTVQNMSLENEDDSSIDLTVMLKELGVDDSRVSRYSNLSNIVPKETKIQLNVNLTNDSFPTLSSTENIIDQNDSSSKTKIPVTVNHEVLKISIGDVDNKSITIPSIFEITTKMTELKIKPFTIFKGSNLTHLQMTTVINSKNVSEQFTTDITPTLKMESVTDAFITTHNENNELSTMEAASTAKSKTDSFNIFNLSQNDTGSAKDNFELDKKTTLNYVHHETQDNVEEHSTIASIEGSIINTSAISKAKIAKQDIDDSNATVDTVNITVYQENDFVKAANDSSEFNDDFQSPLLSESNEPLRRPNRLRRPQQSPSHMKKFNPFRILG